MVRRNPDHAGIRVFLADTQASNGQVDEAVALWREAEAACRRAIELKPNDSKAYMTLGVLLCDKLARPTEAETAFRKVIELTPGEVRAATATSAFPFYARKVFRSRNGLLAGGGTQTR